MENKLKNYAKEKLSGKNFRLLKRIGLASKAIPHFFNLNKIATVYQSDKWGKHFYTKHYQYHFKKYKFRKIKLLEIGVGGYHYPDIGGNSLRMWKSFFPFAKIFALDIYDKSFVQEPRIKIFKGSQVDCEILEKMMEDIGTPDIIIDDGSHVNEHVIFTFKKLFPKLKEGGIYVIEDTQTAYWPDYGGDSKNLNNPQTMTAFFKNLTDGLNHQEILDQTREISYFDQNITSIQFYHNLIFIFKGKNDEPSNIDTDNPESILADKIYI